MTPNNRGYGEVKKHCARKQSRTSVRHSVSHSKLVAAAAAAAASLAPSCGTPTSSSSTPTHNQGNLLSFTVTDLNNHTHDEECPPHNGSTHSNGNRNSTGTGSTAGDVPVFDAGLFRLGVLMAVTMTLHNLPEGFAVAFSAFTKVGPLMAVAIAVHNIPEGVVVAAPIFAATGNRWHALGIATASGLSEPLGALIALVVFKPFMTSVQSLDYVLAFVGGVMMAVCVLELWPEGRKCRHDTRMFQGICLGVVVMGWTLYLGV